MRTTQERRKLIIHVSSSAMAARRYPDFFQVFHPNQFSKRMPIPTAYHKHLPESLPKTALLRGCGGRFWRVGLRRTPQYVYLDSGWQKFTEDCGLRDGDTLTFKYDGSRAFGVTIHRGWGYKVSIAPVEVQEISDNKAEDTDDHGNGIHEDSSDNSYNYSIGSEDGAIRVDGDENNHSFVQPLEEEVDPEIQVKKKRIKNQGRKNEGSHGGCSFDPEKYLEDPMNPFFVTSLKKRNHELYISVAMVRDYGLKFAPTVTLIDPMGRVEGRTKEWNNGAVSVKEWYRICKRNKLKGNDRVICELLCTNGVLHSINLHIIREQS